MTKDLSSFLLNCEIATLSVFCDKGFITAQFGLLTLTGLVVPRHLRHWRNCLRKSSRRRIRARIAASFLHLLRGTPGLKVDLEYIVDNVNVNNPQPYFLVICLKHTIKINPVSEFRFTVYRFCHFGSELIKVISTRDFDLGQVDRNTWYSLCGYRCEYIKMKLYCKISKWYYECRPQLVIKKCHRCLDLDIWRSLPGAAVAGAVVTMVISQPAALKLVESWHGALLNFAVYSSIRQFSAAPPPGSLVSHAALKKILKDIDYRFSLYAITGTLLARD